MLKLISLIIFGVPMAVATLLVPVWYLWYLAFASRLSQTSVWAAFTLGIIITVVIVLAINSMDWLNDWLAAKAVSRTNIDNTKEMAELFRTLAGAAKAQYAQNRVAGQVANNGPKGGLDGGRNIQIDDPFLAVEDD